MISYHKCVSKKRVSSGACFVKQLRKERNLLVCRHLLALVQEAVDEGFVDSEVVTKVLGVMPI